MRIPRSGFCSVSLVAMLQPLCRAPLSCWKRFASWRTCPLIGFTSGNRHLKTNGPGRRCKPRTQEAKALKAAEASLGKEFDLSLGAGTHTPQQLLEWAAVLDEASVWQRLFGRNYRRAGKAYRRIALGKKKALTHGNEPRAQDRCRICAEADPV